MRIYALIFLLLAAAGADGAQTYRWIDEHGVTNYGEKPPPGRAARPVNVELAGTVESVKPPPSRAYEAPAAPAATAPVPREASVAPAPAAPAPRGMEFETYIRLQVGMTEGDVLLRAGNPDHVSIDSERPVFVKSMYYYPTSSNRSLTVVTLHGGRVANIERNRRTD